jgi:hypothetical protein
MKGTYLPGTACSSPAKIGLDAAAGPSPSCLSPEELAEISTRVNKKSTACHGGLIPVCALAYLGE